MKKTFSGTAEISMLQPKFKTKQNLLFIYLFWLQYTACGLLVPDQGLNPSSWHSERTDSNH